jgi:hypothetical protein
LVCSYARGPYWVLVLLGIVVLAETYFGETITISASQVKIRSLFYCTRLIDINQLDFVVYQFAPALNGNGWPVRCLTLSSADPSQPQINIPLGMYSRKAVANIQNLLQEKNPNLKILPPKRASDSFSFRQVMVMLAILFIVTIVTALVRVYL